MGIFDDMESWNERHEKTREMFVKAAAEVPPGMCHEHLVPGAVVTVGPNKLLADRSYMDRVYEVLAFNGCHLALKQVYPSPRDDYDRRPVLLPLHEHDFFAAEQILSVVRENAPITEPPK